MAATDRRHAVITGASSGIGAPFAARLAAGGLNLGWVPGSGFGLVIPNSLKRTTRDGYHSRGEVLIAGGVLNLAYRVLLGYAITVIRAKGAPATPKYLMAAHHAGTPTVIR